jgi:hypothetical protein
VGFTGYLNAAKHALSTQELADPKRSTRKLGGFLFTEHTWFLHFVKIVFSCLFVCFLGSPRTTCILQNRAQNCNVETIFWQKMPK